MRTRFQLAAPASERPMRGDTPGRRLARLARPAAWILLLSFGLTVFLYGGNTGAREIVLLGVAALALATGIAIRRRRHEAIAKTAHDLR